MRDEQAKDSWKMNDYILHIHPVCTVYSVQHVYSEHGIIMCLSASLLTYLLTYLAAPRTPVGRMNRKISRMDSAATFLNAAPSRTTAIESHIHDIKPMPAPSDP